MRSEGFPNKQSSKDWNAPPTLEGKAKQGAKLQKKIDAESRVNFWKALPKASRNQRGK